MRSLHLILTVSCLILAQVARPTSRRTLFYCAQEAVDEAMVHSLSGV
jgi:hypothetical protein